MTFNLALVIYFMIWWLTLFAVLPFGVHTQGESGDVVPGTPASAPSTPRLIRVFVINTVVATIVFAAVYAVLASGVLDMELPPPPPQVTP